MKVTWSDFLRKVSSRKFWAMLIAVIATVLTVFNVDMLTVEQTTAILSGIGALCIYILTEGAVDIARTKAELAEAKPPGEDESAK